MLRIFLRQLVVTILLSLSTPAAAWGDPVVVQLPENSSVQIDATEDYPLLSKNLETLTSEERSVFDSRRAQILQKAAVALRKHTRKLSYTQTLQFLMYGMWAPPKDHAEYAYIKMLNSIDRILISKAKEVANCTGWGVCNSGGLYFAIGYKKWATGLGVFYTVDSIRSFTGNGSTKAHAIEFDFPHYASTKAMGVEVPALLGGLMYRLYIHLDTAEASQATDKLEVEYMRVAPVKVSGPQSVGFGFYTGVGLPPYLSSFMQTKAHAVRISCTQLLGAAKKVLGIKGPAEH